MSWKAFFIVVYVLKKGHMEHYTSDLSPDIVAYIISGEISH